MFPPNMVSCEGVDQLRAGRRMSRQPTLCEGTRTASSLAPIPRRDRLHNTNFECKEASGIHQWAHKTVSNREARHVGKDRLCGAHVRNDLTGATNKQKAPDPLNRRRRTLLRPAKHATMERGCDQKQLLAGAVQRVRLVDCLDCLHRTKHVHGYTSISWGAAMFGTARK